MDFTDILNKGIKKYIDKNLKKRSFGKCFECGKPDLLINFKGKDGEKVQLCEFCYREV